MSKGIFVGLILILQLCAIQTAEANGGWYNTAYRCDPSAGEFEMVFYQAGDQNEKPVNMKKPVVLNDNRDIERTDDGNNITISNPSEIKKVMGVCDLETTPPLTVTIKRSQLIYNIQGECGARSGTADYILEINGERQISWPSAYHRCLRVFSNVPLQGQPLAPTRLKLDQTSLLLLGEPQILNKSDLDFDPSADGFYFGLHEYYKP